MAGLASYLAREHNEQVHISSRYPSILDMDRILNEHLCCRVHVVYRILGHYSGYLVDSYVIFVVSSSFCPVQYIADNECPFHSV